MHQMYLCFRCMMMLIITAILPLLVQSMLCDKNFGEMWNSSWAPEPRNDLRCQLNWGCRKDHTELKFKQYDSCCVCNSCAIWEGTEIDLFIEYLSVLGKSLVFGAQAPTDPDAVYQINHPDSEMTEIPSNLCNWDTDVCLNERFRQEFDSIQVFWEHIVKINFENNKIRKIGNLHCLIRLDELNMRNNRLTYISNTSFTNLTHLRSVDFSENLIQKIDPGILTSAHLNLFWANFSHNKMSELDVSNALSLYPFCNIYMSSNEIKTMVNKADFSLGTTKTYGPGFIHFADNKFAEWPNLQELFQLEDISDLGHLLHLGLDFRNIPIHCDCNIEPFLSLTEPVKKNIWTEYMNVSCASPDDLAGIPVSQVELEKLICNLTEHSGCPTPFCTCTDKPNDNTIVVNCSYNNLGNRLEHLPAEPKSKLSERISLNFSGQQLTNITDLIHYSSISMLDVSYNNILEISNDLAVALEHASFVDLSGNEKLTQLPKLFLQYRNVCSTNMKNLIIDCNCESVWIEEWLKHSKTCINEDFMFECKLPNQEEPKPALCFTAADIDCSPPGKMHTREYVYVISGAIGFLIISGMLIYTFRYELLILCVRLKQRDRNSSVSEYDHDVFLSFNDNDESVKKWINLKLVNCLKNAGYRVFQPSRDIPFGTERDSEVLSIIGNTCNFLLILTDNYLDQGEDGIRPWTENEWKYGWYNYIRDRSKNIVLVNFDHVSSFDFFHPQIKAFLRVGCTIDFGNQNRNIMHNIFKELGQPFMTPISNGRVFENKNFKFPRHEFSPANQNNDTDSCQGLEIDQDAENTNIEIPATISRFKNHNPSVVAAACPTFMSSIGSNTTFQYRCTDIYEVSHNDELVKPAAEETKASATDLQHEPTDLDVGNEEIWWLNVSESICDSRSSFSTDTDDLDSVGGSMYSNTLSASLTSRSSSFQLNCRPGSSITDVSV